MDGVGLMRQQQQQQQMHAPQMERYVINRNILHPEGGMQTEHMRRYGIRSVFEAINAVMRDAYREVQEGEQVAGRALDVLPLYSRRGARLIEQGYDVLEFNMAGSTFEQLPQLHKGISGQPQYTAAKKLQKGLLHILPYVVSVSAAIIFRDKGAMDIRPVVETVTKPKIKEIEQLSVRDAQILRETGQITKIRGQQYKFIRRKEAEKRTKYTIAGPSALNIMGDYTTKASREYVLQLACDYLGERFENADGGEIAPICIKIKGHSRGGVTSSEGAMMIRRWILDNYPEYADSVRFDLIQFDPVSGADTYYAVAQEVNFQDGGADADEQGKFESDGVKYAALGDSAQTTVVYSMHSEHDVLKFTPQVVKGVDRIIITPFEHSAGLNKTDSNKVIDRQGNVTEGEHRLAFIDSETRTAYRLGSLNDLGRGVYLLDEYNTLVRVRTMEQFTAVMGTLYRNVKGVLSGRFSQETRHKAISKAVCHWFDTNPADTVNA